MLDSHTDQNKNMLPSNYVATFSDGVQQYELEQVAARRRHLGQSDDSVKAVATTGNPLDANLVGLAFCGGGIRSATFNLGILQAIGRLGLLTHIDYLSTVSGGGYIHGWLAAWIRRADGNGTTPVETVQSRLDPGLNRKEAGKNFGGPMEPEPETVHHLRTHSRYLAPHFGPLALDTWTLASIYIRNLFINSLALAPALFLIVFMVRLIVSAFTHLPRDQNWVKADGITEYLFYGFLAVLCLVIIIIRWLAPHQADPAVEAEFQTHSVKRTTTTPRRSVAEIMTGVVTFGLLSTAVIGAWLLSPAPRVVGVVGHDRMSVTYREYGKLVEDDHSYIHQVGYWLFNLGADLATSLGSEETPAASTGQVFVTTGLFGLCGLVTGLASALTVGRGSLQRRFVFLCLGVVQAAAFGFFLSVLANYVYFSTYMIDGHTHATFGPPLFLLAALAAGYIEVAVAGDWMTEYEREWRSRLGAVILRMAVVWVVIFGVVVYLPWTLRDLNVQLMNKAAMSGSQPVPWISFVIWLVTTIYGIIAARRQAAGKAGWSLQLIALLAPLIFLTGLMAATSEISLLLTGSPIPAAPYPDRLAATSEVTIVMVTCGVFVLTVATMFLVPATRFSLHSLYMNRLTRCYLGASLRDENRRCRGEAGLPVSSTRQANRFTGFDPNDDLPLTALRISNLPTAYKEGQRKDGADYPYLGPYPIFNATLNLVAGEDLGYQDRKGSSFIFTPGYSGSRETGYALPASDDMATLQNLTVGRVVTISGAAIDPNMRVYQSGPLTAFLTILNARLGWWMRNPHAEHTKSWNAGPPRGGAWYYFREMLGMTNAKDNYVHLSDGGHFENTGAYELIRRKCRYVIVVDAAEDELDASENLAELVRLVRTDFGIFINIDTSAIHKDEKTKLSKSHFAIGEIWYDEADPNSIDSKSKEERSKNWGTLLFIRASMTGDESADLRNYAITNPPFPHHSTVNQFFDEAQFESYRDLGFHIGMESLWPAKHGDWLNLISRKRSG